MGSLRKAGLIGICAVTLLAGCSSAPVMPFGGDPTYDGVWRGRILFTLGESSCPRRGNLVVDINGGFMDGEVRWADGSDARFQAVIKDGVIDRGQVRRGGNEFAQVSGSFAERVAEGRFDGKRCNGTWSLQKIR